MKRFAVFTLSLVLLFFTGCTDQATAPGLDITASYAKGEKPGKPPPDDPPPGDPVDPTILFTEYGGRKLGHVLFQMDADGNRAMALSDGEPIEGVNARWSPDGAHFVFERGISIRKAPDEGHIMIATLDDASGEWSIQRLLISSARADHPDWSSQGWILFNAAADIWSVRPDGSGEAQVTFEGDIRDAIWSRDGTKILAHVHDGSAWSLRIYFVDCDSGVCVETRAPTEIALSDLGDGSAGEVAPLDWAHTKDEVICALGLPTGWDLGVLDLSDPENPILSNLTNSDDSGESQAAWSHDDTQIVHQLWTFEGAPERVVIRDLATGSAAPLTEAVVHFGIDWRPTGPGG